MTERIPRFIMIALIVVSVIVFLMGLGVDEDDPSTYGGADVILITSYIFFGITIVTSLIGALVGVIMKPSAAKGILIGVGGMLLVFILAYTLASGTDHAQYDTTENVALFSGTLLHALYILAALAVGSIIFSGVYRLIR